MDKQASRELDNYITGHYGADQFDGEEDGDEETKDKADSAFIERSESGERTRDGVAAWLNEYADTESDEEAEGVNEISAEDEEEEEERPSGEYVRCQWFLACTNQATRTESHPILGAVPICKRCSCKVERLSA